MSGRAGSRPLVSFIVLTYRRFETLEQTVASLREHVDDYELIICDDGGSSGEERTRIERLEPDLVIWNDRGSYGRSANAGIRAARGEFVFHVEDDQVIISTGHFLEAGMTVLRELREVGAVQYCGENELFRLRAERRVGDLQVEILPFAAERVTGFDLFRYKNRPHLKHRRFHAAYGLYPEGYGAFETEYRFARHVNAVRRARLAWIRDAVVFLDIGKPYGSMALLPPKQSAIDVQQAR
jgi:glycosyltransferase involved in cell wall biosynthesis